jgi:hypothetical protein
MLPYSDSRLTKIALAAFFVLLLAYGYFEARGLLYGPSISVGSTVSEVHDPFVKVQGTAERITSLTMNGKEVPVTEGGQFDEPYLLSPGYNRIVLDAKDKYGNRTSRAIEIMYTPQKSSTPSASSSLATSTPPLAH